MRPVKSRVNETSSETKQGGRQTNVLLLSLRSLYVSITICQMYKGVSDKPRAETPVVEFYISVTSYCTTEVEMGQSWQGQGTTPRPMNTGQT